MNAQGDLVKIITKMRVYKPTISLKQIVLMKFIINGKWVTVGYRSHIWRFISYKSGMSAAWVVSHYKRKLQLCARPYSFQRTIDNYKRVVIYIHELEQ